METFHHSRSREIYPVSSLKEVQESPYYLVFSYSIKLHEKGVNIRNKQGNNTKIGQNENFVIKNPPTSCQVLDKWWSGSEINSLHPNIHPHKGDLSHRTSRFRWLNIYS